MNYRKCIFDLKIFRKLTELTKKQSEPIGKEDLMNANYPNLKQSWGLFGLSIVTQVVAALVISGLPGSIGILTGQLISNILIIAIALKFKSAPIGHLFSERRSVRPWLFPILIIFNLAFLCVNDPIIELIPMPDFVAQMFEQLFEKDIFTFLAVAIAAPIGEELLFRRIMLPGLVANYGERKGILWSAFFFAIFHLNPWQGIGAFLIGIFLAWIFLRTRNIWVCIFLHFFNNALSFLAFVYYDDAMMSITDFTGYGYELAILVVLSLICMYFCVRMLQRHFAKNLDDAETT